jgi:penicillin-insensitive murein DD-endopeptidase
MLFSLFLISSSLALETQLQPEPSRQVVGYYTKGKLSQATSMQRDGKGFVHLFHARNRFWGSQGLIELSEQASAEIAHLFPGGERLQIGDLSAEFGDFISGHKSHQNGLDADFAYFRLDHHEQDPNDLGGFEESFVVNGKLSNNFDLERNWTLIKLMASTGRINRIFVDQVIKLALCRYALEVGDAPMHTETLRRLRPATNHADHLHVRLTCPVTSPKCKSQEEPPKGSGCP